MTILNFTPLTEKNNFRYAIYQFFYQYCIIDINTENLFEMVIKPFVYYNILMFRDRRRIIVKNGLNREHDNSCSWNNVRRRSG